MEINKESKEVRTKIEALRIVLTQRQNECLKEETRLESLIEQEKQSYSNIDCLNESIKTKNSILAGLNDEIEKQRSELEKLNEVVKNIDGVLCEGKREISDINAEIAKTKAEADKLKADFEVLNSANDRASRTNSELEAKKCELGNILKELETAISFKTKEKEDKECAVLELDKEIENKKTVNLLLSGESQATKRLIEQMNSKINVLNKEKNEAETELVSIKTKVSEELDKLKKAQVFFTKQVEQKTEELQKREGEIGQKIQWYEQKRELLKEAKSSLESFYNQKIENIII